MTIEPYVTTSTPDTCAIDFTGHWQPASVLRAMQEAAGEQCAGYGLSYPDLRPHGLAWVLTRAHLRMDAYPAYGQRVEITTWPTAQRHAFFPRQFTIAADGVTVGCMTAVYVVFDLNARKLAPATLLPSPVPACDRPAPLPFPGTVKALSADAERAPLIPGYRDADMNGHINNTRYVDWFCDRFPCERHERLMIADLLIHYNFEVRPGELLTLATQDTGDESVMHGLRDGVSCFAIEARWKPRVDARRER